MTTTPTPTTEEQAVELCIKLAEKFRFQFIIFQKSDFEDLIGTEDWTEEDYHKAVELATEDLANNAGDSIQHIVNEINESR